MFYGYQGNSIEPTPNNPKHPMPPEERPKELAQAYVPVQKYVNSFSPQEALKHGTLFPELVRPYTKRC